MKPDLHPQIIEKEWNERICRSSIPGIHRAARVDQRHGRPSRASQSETRRRRRSGQTARRSREGSGTVAFGTKLYAQPSRLPVMEFPWWDLLRHDRHFFGGGFVPDCTRASPRCSLAAILKQELTGRALLNYLRRQQQSFHPTLNHAIPCPTS